MILAIVLIFIILLFLAVLVILLVDALVNDSDVVINTPGVGMDSGVYTGDREHVHTAPIQSQPVVGRTQRTVWPETTPVVLTQKDAEIQLARMMRDPELRKIPPMLFPQQNPERPDGKPQIELFPIPAVPLLLPPVLEKSIVEQINDILQIRIAGTPLEQRDVRLIETPTGGVIVKVGPLYFDGIDAVTDPDVKAALKAAVAEWEAEQ